MKPNKPCVWAVKWASRNRMNGVQEHLTRKDCVPILFRTKREAIKWIDSNYAYLRARPDLRSEPFGWRRPKAVKVKIEIV